MEGNGLKTIMIIGTLDTKGEEHAFLKQILETYGYRTLLVDIGIMEQPGITPDITAREVAKKAGYELEELKDSGKPSWCLDVMGNGAGQIVSLLFEEHRIDGIIGMGGGQGTFMISKAMSCLPVGFPKVLISTIATLDGDQMQFFGIKDTMVLNPLVDISGVNSIFKMIVERAAAALDGMLCSEKYWKLSEKKVVAISMWGVVTPCGSHIREKLERAGYEVWVFHTTGIGGRIMEDLIDQGSIQGLVDLSLPELSNPICKGCYPDGAYRCTAAGRAGIPQTVIPGGIDMIRIVPPNPIPELFGGRKTYLHNANLRFVRSNAEENKRIAEELSEKLNESNGEVSVLLPFGGLSAVDKKGAALYEPDTDKVLFDTLEDRLCSDIQLIKSKHHINDLDFADLAADTMLDMLAQSESE